MPPQNCHDVASTYSYDAANELRQIGYSDGATPGVGFTYLPTGQRATMSDGTGTTSYGYDSRNRLTSTTNGAGQAVGYGYDADSNLTGLTYPGTLPVTRTYDALDRLSGVADWLGHTTGFAFDDNGSLQLLACGTFPGATLSA